MAGRSGFTRRVAATVGAILLLLPVTAAAQPVHGTHTPWYEKPLYPTPWEVWISGEGWDEDYQSSEVCIAGYRWITRRNSESNQSAAADAYPVRC
jgi:hypothetical protein